MAPFTSPILNVEGVSHAFGGVYALDDCTLTVNQGAIAAVIGPNGAGKSTLVNVATGLHRIQRGRIVFGGQDISGWPSHRVAEQGLFRTFQISREFASLTVLENLLVVAPGQKGEWIWNAVLRPSVGRQQDQVLLKEALRVVETFGLYEARNEYSTNLSGGQKRLLELARAVMAKPKLLILDEPMAGVNPVLIHELVAHIRTLRESGITFVLVEHNLDVVADLCDQVIVMAEGHVIAEGSMAQVRENPAVIEAYLGAGAIRA